MRLTHSKYFNNAEEVGAFFGRNIASKEALLIFTFLTTGVKPIVGGCWHCTESVVRTLCGWVEYYEKMVERGEAQDWRTSGTTAADAGLPYGVDWS
jgi:hypothetical protein